MPISRASQSLYPSDWWEISQGIKTRAGWRCECCGVPHMAWGWRDHLGQFHDLGKERLWAAGYRKTPFGYPLSSGAVVRAIEILLTCAHLDHDPTNSNPDNLRAWCQKCHLAYDAPHHRRNAGATRRAAMGTDELPL